MYLNITNWCSNDCLFCLRNFKDGVQDYNLKLEKEPNLEEIWDEFQSKYDEKIKEVVFCGVGESLYRLDDIVLPLSKKISETYNKSIRIVTNGHVGILFPGRNIAKELKDSGVSKISISLNAENHVLYNKLCKPQEIIDINDPSVYEYVKTFIQNCSNEMLKVEATALKIPKNKMIKYFEAPNIIECKKIAEKLGAVFRERKYFGPKLR